MPIDLIQSLFSNDDDVVTNDLSGGLADGENVDAIVHMGEPVDMGAGNDLLIGLVTGTAVNGGGFNGIDIEGDFSAGAGDDMGFGGTLAFVDGNSSIDGVDIDSGTSWGWGCDAVLGYAIAVAVPGEAEGCGDITSNGIDMDGLNTMGAGKDVVAGAAALLSGSNTTAGGEADGIVLEVLDTGAGNDVVFGLATVLVENVASPPDDRAASNVEASVSYGRGPKQPSIDADGIEVLESLDLGGGDDMVIGLAMGSATGVSRSEAIGIDADDVTITGGWGDDYLFGHAVVNFGEGGSDESDLKTIESHCNTATGIDISGSDVDLGIGSDKILGFATANLGDGYNEDTSLEITGIDMTNGAFVVTKGGADVVMGIAAGSGKATGIDLSYGKGGRSEGVLETGVGNDVVIGMSGGEHATGIKGGTIDLGRGDDILAAGATGDDDEIGLDGTSIYAGAGNDVIYVDGGNGFIDGGRGYDTLILTAAEDELKISTEGDTTYISGEEFSLEVVGIEYIIFDAPETQELVFDETGGTHLIGDPIGLGDVNFRDTGVDKVVAPLEEFFGNEIPFTPSDFSVVGLLEFIYSEAA